jgi:hypothetical protein
MSTVLSLLGVAVFIIVTVSVAAAVTWSVVRLTPTKSPQTTPKKSS